MSAPSAPKHIIPGPGWEALWQPEQYVHPLSVLLLATLSGLLLAYHPVHRMRSLTADDLEEKKTLVIYSSVGALIAIICTVAPSMAFVIFGIGGLLRFRTVMGESKSTGHAIMGTLLGLCWGLELQLVAVLATLYFWVMIYVMESRVVRELSIVGVDAEHLSRAAEAYRGAFLKAGCKVIGHSKNLKKAKLNFLLQVPRGFAADEANKAVEAIPSELRGNFDWPE
jgi:hypothetical protein